MSHFAINVNWYPYCVLGREDAPEHFFRRTAITSPDCQEFMVWRIFSVVLIFMSPLLDEFTLIEVFQRVNSSSKGLMKMVTTEKILQTMSSWHWWELIVKCARQVLGGSSRSSRHLLQILWKSPQSLVDTFIVSTVSCFTKTEMVTIAPAQAGSCLGLGLAVVDQGPGVMAI